jgi:hypothetical protein
MPTISRWLPVHWAALSEISGSAMADAAIPSSRFKMNSG